MGFFVSSGKIRLLRILIVLFTVDLEAIWNKINEVAIVILVDHWRIGNLNLWVYTLGI
jgi:hypothetical protein